MIELMQIDLMWMRLITLVAGLICIAGGTYTLYRVSKIEANQHKIMECLGIEEEEAAEQEVAYRTHHV